MGGEHDVSVVTSFCGGRNGSRVVSGLVAGVFYRPVK